MKKTFGKFIKPEDGEEYLIIRFSPTAVPLQNRWRNNGLSADFLAEYWSTFFPAYNLASPLKQNEIKGGISYIANELLENMMKFSYAPANYPASLGLYLYSADFRFYGSNAINPANVANFQARIQKLLTEETAELYMLQIEKNASFPDPASSGLGLLTMLNDYEAKLAWQFEELLQPNRDKHVMVTTMVTLSTD